MTEDPALLKTPLHAEHVAAGGRMVDFAGWSMPVLYGSIVAEHHAVRGAVGLFDVSHMGRLRLTGPGAAAMLDRTLTRRTDNLRPGRIRYSLVCNERGGVLDDVLAYAPANDADDWRLVVNASNRERIVAHLREQARDAEVIDETRATAMIAVQGPRAIAIVKDRFGWDVGALKNYAYLVAERDGAPLLVSRTGYTGEDGCEIVAPADQAAAIWRTLAAAAAEVGGGPCGLGARDTLRLEAAMPLYGHELTEEIDPLQAGLAFAVDTEGRDFIGAEALRTRSQDAGLPIRVGLQLAGKRIAREGTELYAADSAAPVGRVASGALGPTLGASLAMAYLPRNLAAPGTQLEADIRGKREAATVVELPFYRRGV